MSQAFSIARRRALIVVPEGIITCWCKLLTSTAMVSPTSSSLTFAKCGIRCNSRGMQRRSRNWQHLTLAGHESTNTRHYSTYSTGERRRQRAQPSQTIAEILKPLRRRRAIAGRCSTIDPAAQNQTRTVQPSNRHEHQEPAERTEPTMNDLKELLHKSIARSYNCPRYVLHLDRNRNHRP